MRKIQGEISSLVINSHSGGRTELKTRELQDDNLWS
jgi:hypothetical protein